MSLCRLLIDPDKVRVSIRRMRDTGKWFVFIASRTCPTRGFAGVDERAERALIIALTDASNARMIGVDLGMSYTFAHPFNRRDRVRDAEVRRALRILREGETQLARDVLRLVAGEM